MIEKIHKLSSLCQISMSINFNDHKAVYEDPKSYYFDRRDEDVPDDVDLTKDIWEIRCYFVTPVSFYDFVGNDLEELLDQAIQRGEEIDAREKLLRTPCPECGHQKHEHFAVADDETSTVYGYCTGSDECECHMLKDEF